MLPPAPLWRRLMAMLYDSFLLFAIIMFYGALHLGAKILLFGAAYQEQLKNSPAGFAADSILFIGMLTAIYLFFYIFWRRNGQTLGMQVWRVQIQKLDGSSPNARQILLRLITAVFSLLCGGLGYLWCLRGEKKTWQDILSKTHTVLLPKLKK